MSGWWRLAERDRELVVCPRCKLKLKAEFVQDEGVRKIWWMCENVEKCLFPLDMPGDIFCIAQSDRDAIDGFLPLPRINKLPLELRYMYPINFPANGTPRPSSSQATTCNYEAGEERCESACSISANSLSSSTGTSKITTSQPSVKSQCFPSEDCSSDAADGSLQTYQEDRSNEDDLDADIEQLQSTEVKPVRTLKRKYPHNEKSITKAVIETLSEEHSLVEMQDETLLEVVRKLTAELGQPRRPAHFSPSARMRSYCVDDYDVASNEYLEDVDFSKADFKPASLRDRINLQQALKKTRSGKEILSLLGAKYKSENTVHVKNVVSKKVEEFRDRIERMLEQIKVESSRKELKKQNTGEEKRCPTAGTSVGEDEQPQSSNSFLQKANARVLNKLRQHELQRMSTMLENNETVAENYAFAEPAPAPMPMYYIPEYRQEDDADEPCEQVQPAHDEWSLNLEGLYDDFEQTRAIPPSNSNVSSSGSNYIFVEENNELRYNNSTANNVSNDTSNLDNDEFVDKMFGL